MVQARVGGSERLGQITEIVALAELMRSGGETRGNGRHEAALCIAHDCANGQDKLEDRLEEGLKGGLVLAAQPATAQDAAGEQLADTPELGLACFGTHVKIR